MTSDFDNTDRLAIEINECKHMGIEVLPPDINESFLEFAIVPDKNQIRFGMNAIKNVGTGAVEEILRARETERGFKSSEDFFSKVNTRIVNRKAVESLIKAGAFDRFAERSTLLASLDVVLAYASRLQKAKVEGQTDLFGEAVPGQVLQAKLTLAPGGEINPAEMLRWERELLGIYLSNHPLDQFELILSEQTIPLSQLTAEHEGKSVTVGGAVNDVREIVTKNGKKMAFVKVADKFGEIELVLFPGSYQPDIWYRDGIVVAKGKLSSRDRNGASSTELKVLVDEARALTHDEAVGYQPTGKTLTMPKGPGAKATPPATITAVPERVYLRLNSGEDQELLLSLKRTIDGYHGDTEVVLVLGEEVNKQIIKLPMRISKEPIVITELKTLLGEPNVKLH